MQLCFIIIFASIFLSTFICIVIFRRYKDEYIKTLDTENFSIKSVLGFAAICTDLLHKISFFKNSKAYSKEKKLLSSINVGTSAENNIYTHHMRLLSYSIIVILISSFLGLAYCLTLADTNKENISTLTRPSVGEGKQNISLITDSEMFSGTIDISIDEEKYSFEETMELFGSYRAEFDSTVLGENVSFLHVTAPLVLPSTIGNEGITISWHISDPNIIDYSGSLIEENISADGSSLELTATLSLGNFSADICYQLKVYPPEISTKDSLVSFINDYINSDFNSTETTINLPNTINGHAISFFKEKTVYPSLDFFSYSSNPLYYYHFFR